MLKLAQEQGGQAVARFPRAWRWFRRRSSSEAAALLTDLHVLKYHQAIQTVWRTGHDDWRLATITGDENREPDPVLLWRPVTHSPFNAQRFKGPMAEIPKPAECFA